jgi:hypothetical protein
LRESVGVRYRIAYLGAADSSHPGLVAGQAVLYNEARLKNVTGAPANRIQDGRSRPTVLGVNPRRSYPCEYPAAEFQDPCSVLDGDGAYWTSVFADPTGAKHFESGFVRFAFVADEQSQFNFYNVHLHPDVPGSVTAATDLVMSMEALRFAGTVYPPIIAGDFNGGTEAFPTFQEFASGSPPAVIDYIIAGTPPEHSATYAMKSVGSAQLPGPSPNPDGICAPRSVAWSDHCAVVAYLEPAVQVISGKGIATAGRAPGGTFAVGCTSRSRGARSGRVVVGHRPHHHVEVVVGELPGEILPALPDRGVDLPDVEVVQVPLASNLVRRSGHRARLPRSACRKSSWRRRRAQRSVRGGVRIVFAAMIIGEP